MLSISIKPVGSTANILEMENSKTTSSPIRDFYKNKTIFITGGTGFLGMVLIEKLLYSCEVKNIYMLVKPKKGKNIQERLLDILNTEAFQRIKEEKPKELNKIIPISGDLLENDLGLNHNDREILQEEVTVVLHSAANINLNMQLLNAINVNTRGAEKLVRLCKEMKRLEVFVYVSSAYSQSNKEVIDEIVYSTKCKLESFSHVVDHIDGNSLARNLIENRPNTYTHSKALAEEIIATELEAVPVVIVRPSGITSAVKEPIPGWIQGWSGMNMVVMCSGKGFLRVWPADPDSVSDIIPVDMVSNLTLAAAWDIASNKRDPVKESVKVFNICSGLQNPLTLGQLLWGHVKHGRKYYNCDTLLPPYLLIIKHRYLYLLMSFLFQTIPAYMFSWIEFIFRQQPRAWKLHRKIIQTGKVLNFFGRNQFLLNDYNVKQLFLTMEDSDKETFHFDIKVLKWDEYLESYVIGIKKYLLREK